MPSGEPGRQGAAVGEGRGGPLAVVGDGQERGEVEVGTGQVVVLVPARLGDVVLEVGRGVHGGELPAEGVALAARHLGRRPGAARRGLRRAELAELAQAGVAYLPVGGT